MLIWRGGLFLAQAGSRLTFSRTGRLPDDPRTRARASHHPSLAGRRVSCTSREATIVPWRSQSTTSGLHIGQQASHSIQVRVDRIIVARGENRKLQLTPC